jgi:ABC-type phosphate/phosphonate transport system substrate-binding protein
MYPLPETASATAIFWDELRKRLIAGGLDVDDVVFGDPPANAPQQIGPGVLFTQFCGYPLFKLFRNEGDVLATPSFSFAGCEGPYHRAFFMVRADDPAEKLEDLRGRVFGCNSRLSNTGMNLPRLMLARIAEGRPFFRSVVMTGGHLASLDHLDNQTIDACSIDCVTWGLFRKYRPAEAARVLEALRESLDAVFSDPATAATRETLGLTSVSQLTTSAYERLVNNEKEAADLGYPNLE